MLALVAGTFGLAQGCAPVETDTAASGGALEETSSLFVDQGWSAATRDSFYSTSQGSQLLPYDWFLHLERADRQELLRGATLDALRWTANAKSASNPDGLPVGFVKDSDPATGSWVGLTCAACHTAQLDYRGKSVRIDGAGGLGDFNGLVESVAAALTATADDDAKFTRFSTALGRARDTTLREELRTFATSFAAYTARNRPTTDHGFGRVDSYNRLTNEMTGTALGLPTNVAAVNAPLNFPYLWQTSQLDWQTSNGAINNSIARMCLEVIGVFGKFEVDRSAPAGTLRFQSSIRTKNLHTIDEKLRTLNAPKWPSAVFGPIDTERATAGAKVFTERKCDSCHGNRAPYAMTSPNAFGKQFIETKRVPLAEIGTDPSFLNAVAGRNAATGPLAGALGSATASSATVTKAMLGVFLAAELPSLGLTPAELVDYAGFHENTDPGDTQIYKAKPLAGIWASAPFFHNGSVASLHEVLLPAAERKPSFHLGSRTFDPVKVGFEDAGTFVLRSSDEGSSNAGHSGPAYGTDMSDAERWALVEYLKTL